jgi:Invasion associated locus B (IalB) protein
MHDHRQWRCVLPLMVATVFAAPAFAQQTDQAQQTPAAQPTAPAVAPAAPPKPHKHKPAAAPAAATPAAATAPAAPAAAAAPAAPAATAAPAAAIAGGAKPTLLGQYGDWGAYTASPGGKKICFAIAKPTSSETNPPNRPRNPSYMFISSRPGDKVSNEVSITIGYPFKPSSEATMEVGSNSFELYTQQDGAWIKDAAEEAHLLDSLRTGQNAVVKGMSAKGTHSTDTFSLRGFAQALDRTAQDCK